MGRVDAISLDLRAEQAELDRLAASLDDLAWTRPTPAEGWTVADQLSHLAYFDGTAALALGNKEGFAEHRAWLLSGAGSGADVGLGRSCGAGELLATWRENRQVLDEAAAGADRESRVPWYGPDMSLASFLT
ncbi:MAG: maleylpyruvate isomerase N-terminal domain-containing protein, partial [Acidimicrobiales bacterium]